jgi:hypothetical protein
MSKVASKLGQIVEKHRQGKLHWREAHILPVLDQFRGLQKGKTTNACKVPVWNFAGKSADIFRSPFTAQSPFQSRL